MRKYSDFFQTLHDEQSPAGYLGRGTHYSVLRAVVFHDPAGLRRLNEARYTDFAVVWDEDHDDRVIAAIEQLYYASLLPSFLIFGERKGIFTAILANEVKDENRISLLKEKVHTITSPLRDGDSWTSSLGTLKDTDGIINDAKENVSLYIANIAMLWQLGTKEIPQEQGQVPSQKEEILRVHSLVQFRPNSRLAVELRRVDQVGKVIRLLDLPGQGGLVADVSFDSFPNAGVERGIRVHELELF